jgi:hypothetical protein
MFGMSLVINAVSGGFIDKFIKGGMNLENMYEVRRD